MIYKHLGDRQTLLEFTVPSVDRLKGWGRKSSGLQGMDRTRTDRVRAGVRQPYSDPRIALLTNIWAAEHLPECWLSKVGEAGSGLDAALLLLLTLKRAANSECLGLLPASTETVRTQGWPSWASKDEKGIREKGSMFRVGELWLKQGRGVHWGSGREAGKLTFQAQATHMVSTWCARRASEVPCLCRSPRHYGCCKLSLQTRKQVQIGCRDLARPEQAPPNFPHPRHCSDPITPQLQSSDSLGPLEEELCLWSRNG